MTFHPFGFTSAQQRQLGWRSWLPALPLRPWLECYYLLRPQTGSQRYRFYPDGGATLTLPLHEPDIQNVHFSHNTRQSQLVWRPGESRLGIRFTPGGFYALFGLSMAEVEAEPAGWLAQAASLPELFAVVADCGPHHVEVLDRFFLQQLRRREPQSSAVQFWCQAGLRAPQEVRALLARKGIGRRTLERQFQHQVGVSPGQLYQWLRLKQARYLLREYPEQALTDIAARLGYYDQAHFVRQFRQLCAQSPSQYRQRKLSQLYKAEQCQERRL